MILDVKEAFRRKSHLPSVLETRYVALCCIVFLEEISIFFANYFLPQGIML